MMILFYFEILNDICRNFRENNALTKLFICKQNKFFCDISKIKIQDCVRQRPGPFFTKMADEAFTKHEIISLIARVAALTAFSYITMKWLVDALDPTRKQQVEARERAKKLLKSIGVPSDIKLSNHEMMVASNLVEPKRIPVSWDDIAGLEGVIEELRETVILPIKERDLFSTSNLTKAPRGVLLHGPPGM